jgi:hypothetical protein
VLDFSFGKIKVNTGVMHFYSCRKILHSSRKAGYWGKQPSGTLLQVYFSGPHSLVVAKIQKQFPVIKYLDQKHACLVFSHRALYLLVVIRARALGLLYDANYNNIGEPASI